MRPYSWSYKVVATVISLSLLLQMGVPIAKAMPASSAPILNNSPLSSLAEVGFPLPANATPEGVLLDGGVGMQNTPTQPALLSQPLSVSRVQSAYTPSQTLTNTLVITFTVTNNLPVTHLPNIPEGATITETAELLAETDISRDPNTIRNIVLTNSWSSSVLLIEESIAAHTDNNSSLWNIGDLPPKTSQELVVTLQLQTSISDFTDLDSGATAYGFLQGRAVSAQTAPTSLAPDSFAEWLIWTADANIYDEQMLAQAAELGQEPTALFEYVRSFSYESYLGSLRGTRGTLWSRAGNSIDQSGLLIAMLRASGIPARYRHGTLDTPTAQILIASMFPAPTQLMGHVPEGTETSDPVNDPALITEAQDHWWVEAYLPGTGWTNMDPSFANANLGDSFTSNFANDGTDQIAELPDNLRHKVHITLRVEQMGSFPMTGSPLDMTSPLTATLNVVEVVGLPVNIGFWVETETQGGLVFTNYIHSYTPYLSLGLNPGYLEGETFQDFLTNFPLSSYFTTGIWLEVTQQSPDGSTYTDERMVKDIIGAEARQNGGDITLPARDGEPLIQFADLFQLQIVPNSAIPQSEVERLQASLLTSSTIVADAQLALSSLPEEDVVAAAEYVEQYTEPIITSQMQTLALLGATFQRAALSEEQQFDPSTMLVRSYPDAPQLLLMTQTTLSDTQELTFELLNIAERAIAYPGQAKEAEFSANMMRTMFAKDAEYQILSVALTESPQSAYNTFATALNQNLPLTMATLKELANLAISDEAKARITEALLEGYLVIVPQEMVEVEGVESIGWMEVDGKGNVSFVDQLGRKAGIIETTIIAKVTAIEAAKGGGTIAGIVGVLMFFIAYIVPGAIALVAGVSKGGVVALLLAGVYFALNETLAICATFPPTSGTECSSAAIFTAVFLAGFIGMVAIALDPSLSESWFNWPLPVSISNRATTLVTANQTVAGNSLALSAQTNQLTSFGAISQSWGDIVTHGLLFEELVADNVSLYQDSLLLGTGVLSVTETTSAYLVGQPISIELTGEGSQSLFAESANGMGGGMAWLDYTTALTATQPYTFTLHDTVLFLNGESYTGTLTAVVNGSAWMKGTDISPMPYFSSATALQTNGTDISLAPLSGSFTVDGNPVPVVNGLAIAGYNGEVTLNESGTTLDMVDLNGVAQFFTLDLQTSNSTITPLETSTITPTITANFTDSYTLTVEAADGWDVGISASGVVTATPASGVSAGTYTLWISAQSSQYPDLFVTALQTITISPFEGMALSIENDVLQTVPMGHILDPNAILDGINGHLVNGQAEVPNASYVVELVNSSTSAHTFDVTVTGLPAGWTVLSSAGIADTTTLSLDIGEMGQIGLYISPTLSTILPPGSSYPFQVTATAQDNPSLTETESLLFVMPGLAFPYPQLSPTFDYVSAGEFASWTLTLMNVGNIAGTLPYTLTLYDTPFTTQAISPTLLTSPPTGTTPSLLPDQAITETITMTTTSDMAGRTYFLAAQTASGEFLPTAYSTVVVANEHSGPIFQAGDSVELCTANETLAGVFTALAMVMNELENSCYAGSCSPLDQTATVLAAQNLSTQLQLFSTNLDRSALDVATEMLDSATDDAGISVALEAISNAISPLAQDVCNVAFYQPNLQWNPTNDAVLLGDTLPYTLTLANTGSQTATYELLVTLPTGTTTFSQTVSAGNTATFVYPLTPADFGFFLLQSQATAMESSVATDSSSAGLNVVDKFIQLLAVTPQPAFVETGVSSTTLSIEVANIANIPQTATAHIEILPPTGSLSYTNDLPLSILTGDPRSYELTVVDTSGWATGLYTVTVGLLDENSMLIPDGSNYGYLAVGQGLGATQSLSDQLLPPGTLTVTTAITTEILQETILPLAPQPTVDWHFAGIPQPPTPNDDQQPTTDPIPSPTQQPITHTPELPASLQMTGSITRTENSHTAMTYTGSWTHVTSSSADRASAGTYHSSTTAGNTASFTFTGQWLSVGFATTTSNGIVEIAIDGVSQGQFDLYSRANDTASYNFNVISGTHTLLITVTGLKNSFSSNDTILLDYIDVWDGTMLPSGTFEQDDARVALSDNWTTATNAIASGGSYLRNGETAWFAFTDDSITLQTIADGNGETIKISIDGVFKGYYNLDSFDVVTRTFSFENLGIGPHILEVRAYRSEPTIDAFFVPAISPEIPPTIGDFHRYEENDPTILYNGFPYTSTKTSWNISAEWITSRGYIASSQTTADNATLTFTGTTVAVGFMTSNDSGQAELFIDGISQGVLDLYSRSDDVKSFYYRGLNAGTHTLTLNVLGSKHPNSSNELINLDYIDVWSGTNLPDGTFEESNSRVIRNNVWWERDSDPVASGGSYYFNFVNGPVTAWFPFTGDSFTYQAIADPNGSTFLEVTIDGQPQGYVNLYNPTTITRTFSYDGLGSGLHVAQLQYRTNYLTLDAFHTPAIEPGIQPITYTGIVRYEEYNSALRYNGYEYAVRPTSWNTSYLVQASNVYLENSSTAGNTISLDFTGEWVNLAFRTRSNGGTGEIFVDGISYGTMNFLTPSEGFTSTQISLVNGFHTVSVTVVSGNIWLDYIDIWDGSPMPDDFVNANLLQPTGRIHFSGSWDNVANTSGIEGDYIRVSLNNATANTWYSFVGDSFTFYAFSRNTTIHANVYVDGQLIENVSLDYDFSEVPLAFHYTGFDYGAHNVRIGNGNATRIDGFASNPTELVDYRPMIEWYDTTPAGNGAPFFGTFGTIVPIAVGDVNEDGTIELVVVGDIAVGSDTLYLYRADGQDTGDGDPILWSVDGFGDDIGSPAIADLDGNPGAEIVFASNDGLFALYNDGTTYWSETTFVGNLVRATPALGNLDADPQPEIVVNMDDTLAVYEYDGTLAWSHTFAFESGHPLLADMTGDGILDIVVVDWDDNVYLYDYNFGTPTLVWTVSVASSFYALFGSPAIADIDGLQPGGDPEPEIALTSYGLVTVLNHDGSTVWSTAIGADVPGGVSIADIDGDGEVEIVTGTHYNDGIGEGRIYTLNADGSLLWSAPAYDSTSANSTSVLDLDGDGVYEIAWNGKETGLTIFNGADGSMLYNEPLIYSHTATDYPAIADVDLDGYAEVVVPNLKGVAILGWDQVWAASRSIWNQPSYHITNINDDLTVPESEPNSWEVHNTYRTQTPESNGLPNYRVTITYTRGISEVTVLTDTFSLSVTESDPAYRWAYQQPWYRPTFTTTFASEVANLRPGEVRQVSQGTEVLYTLPSGTNRLLLPPMYVTAGHLIEIDPAVATAYAGISATYTVTLFNLSTLPATYTLTIAGLPTAWVTLPATVTVPADGQINLSLLITVPEDVESQSYEFAVTAKTDAGISDAAGAVLNVINALDLAVFPAAQSASAGEAIVYSLTLTNHLTITQLVLLSANGGVTVEMPASLNLSASSSQTLPITITGTSEGANPFTIIGNGLGSDRDTALHTVIGDLAVALSIDPQTATGGVGSLIAYTVTVTNAGTLTDSYTLTTNLPASWTGQLFVNGLAVSELSLNPSIFNSGQLILLIEPPIGTVAGSYPISITATSQKDNTVIATDNATAVVNSLGVDVQILPSLLTTLAPTDTGNWSIQVTNNGSVADTFDLAVAGIFANLATFTPANVTLNPGESQTVQLTTLPFLAALPQSYLLQVMATSVTNADVLDVDSLVVTFTGYTAVDVEWLPDSQTADGTTDVKYLLILTNTGNLPASVSFTGSTFDGLSAELSLTNITLAPHLAAAILVTIPAQQQPGTYQLVATANAGTANDSDIAELIIIGVPTALHLQTSQINHPANLPSIWLWLIALTSLLTLFTLAPRRRRTG